MSLQIPDEFVKDSEILEEGEGYNLLQIFPCVIVDGVLINYIVVNKNTGAYEFMVPDYISARAAFGFVEDHRVESGETEEVVCH